MLRRHELLVSALALAVTPALVSAATIAYDNFESYGGEVPVESALGVGLNGGSGFLGAYNVDDAQRGNVMVTDRTSSPVIYSNGSISINGGNRALRLTGGAGVVTELLTRRTPNLTSTFYFSFLFRTSNIATSDEDFLQVGFSDDGLGEPNMSLGLTGATADTAPGYYFVRSGTGATNQTRSTSSSPAASTTYLMVGKVTKSGASFDNMSLFLNPSTYTEPAATLSKTNSSSVGTLSYFHIRTARWDPTDVYVLDELRISDTFASVIPEPAALSILAIGVMGLLARRRAHAA